MSSFAFPSKTFIAGEYAVLAEGVALLLGHGPHFAASFTAGEATHPFHLKSPAGILAGSLKGRIDFRDPHCGKGGLGASGAEFLSVWTALHGTPGTDTDRQQRAWQAWEAHRGQPGSGADILTQAYGSGLDEDFLLFIDIPARKLERLPRRLGLTISLFHTGRKLATHGHLEKVPQQPGGKLARCVLEAAEALRSADGNLFVRAISGVRDTLVSLSLTTPHTLGLLESVLTVPGVLTAKGCGAMGSDVVLVVHAGDAELSGWAQMNSLTPVHELKV